MTVRIVETHSKGKGYISRNENIVYYPGHEDASLKKQPTTESVYNTPQQFPTTTNIYKFYKQNKNKITKVPNLEIVILMDDFDDKISGITKHTNLLITIGHLRLDSRNLRKERLICFYIENDPFICNLGFQHHNKTLYT